MLALPRRVLERPKDALWRPPWVGALLLSASVAIGCAASADTQPQWTGGKADGDGMDAVERAEWVVAEIEAWNAPFSDADRTEKYCLMAESPFRFFRGTNHLYWADLGQHPLLAELGDDKTVTWIQGDLHADNFGAYDDDRGDVIYGLNDFDEALVADYQLDLWRMATSLLLVARENDNLTDDEQRDVVNAFVESYLDTMASYRGNDDEEHETFTADSLDDPLRDFLDDVERKKSREKALEKWTIQELGERRFDLSLDDLEALDAGEEAALRAAMPGYGETLTGALHYDESYFAIKSMARRLHAGTGSLGTPRFYVLIEGESSSTDDDRILDVKRQISPTALHYLSDSARSDYLTTFANHAQRHATACRALTKHTDDHLGWLSLPDGDYSVRERSVYKEAFPTAELKRSSDYEATAAAWGAILATDHARADEDFAGGPLHHSVDKHIDEQTDGHHREMRRLVRGIAFSYAEQVDADFSAFLDFLGDRCP